MKHNFLFFLLSLTFLSSLFIVSVSAIENYADLTLKLDEKGVLSFSGTTNYNDFSNEKSEYFTSKKGPFWLLNITTKQKFSDYYISVEFPKNTEINYIKTKGSFRITETPSLQLITTGENEPIEIIVQYRISQEDSTNYLPYLVWSVAIIILILLSMFFAKQIKNMPANKKTNDNLKIIRHTLTDNQNLILDILIQAKEPVTQKQLQHRTNLPKATLSRNIDLLVQKKVITKQSRGMVNVIFLSDDFKK